MFLIYCRLHLVLARNLILASDHPVSLWLGPWITESFLAFFLRRTLDLPIARRQSWKHH